MQRYVFYTLFLNFVRKNVVLGEFFTMHSSEIRSQFFKFFENKGHKIVPTAPLVIKNDPTLMFTNAGMNQFKDIFLGNNKPENTRVADTQKCLRVSGKHNDLEEVGFDTYHHTFFEMLGNWSFGDYFKKEAIEYSWELLTQYYHLPAERLYATVFRGDKTQGLQFDDESFQYWKNFLPVNQIIEGSLKDNFWEMGETGPCGPCSEIHIDLRSESERKKIPGEKLVNTGNPLVVELWNLVFIEYNRQVNGTLLKLPEKHVDTGMGFERLAMAIQSKNSNYETDIFQTLIAEIVKLCGTNYGVDEKKDVAYRVIADHIRAVAFAIADGQIPSNIKAGYVIRRILRRAVRFGYTFLNFKEPFLYKLLPVLAEQFNLVFPEVSNQLSFIEKVIREEEKTFLNTLESGLKKLDELLLSSSWKKIIEGEPAFELYDTYGFPLDLTQLIARENGYSVDEKGFNSEMEKQKERSKQKGKINAGDWFSVNKMDTFSFTGYDQIENTAHILQYRKVNIKGKDFYQFVLDKTPFFAESGGQVGDTGEFIFENQTVKV
ncbi:MAG: alanine--tRNA ligase, partial [Bacteroidetes bacterium RIFCSPLOWO2_12_FULL_37_12]